MKESETAENLDPEHETGSPASGGLSVVEPLEEKLEKEIRRIIQPDLSGTNQLVDQVNKAVLSVVRRELYQGPVPHPSHYQEYERVHPGSANRLLSMAEKNQNQRHLHENRALILDFIYSYSGLVFGFLVAIFLVIGAYRTAQNGHDLIAAVFLAASAIGMVGSLIQGRNIANKRSNMPPPKLETMTSNGDLSSQAPQLAPKATNEADVG